jgi:DNA-binding transcriptional MerR regulator
MEGHQLLKRRLLMPEEKELGFTSGKESLNRRKDFEEALAVWKDVGAELNRLLAAVPEELSVQELESKTQKLLAAVKAMEGKRQRTFNHSPGHGAHEEAPQAGLEPPQTTTAARKYSITIPGRQYFKIGEISEMLDVEPYVLRYWESEFKILKPTRTRARQRLYHEKDVEKLRLIKHLIYDEKSNIPGVKKRLREIFKEKTKRVKRSSVAGRANKTPAEQQVTSDSVPAGTDHQDYGKILLEIKQMLKDVKERLES